MGITGAGAGGGGEGAIANGRGVAGLDGLVWRGLDGLVCRHWMWRVVL